MLNVSTQPIVAVNVAFSQTGLKAINVTESIGSNEFTSGQFSAAQTFFGDNPARAIPAFAGTIVHGVFLIVSDTQARVTAQTTALETTLGSSIVKLHSLVASSRPGGLAGKERVCRLRPARDVKC